MLALLILCAALVTLASPFLHIVLHCNNCNVISHSNSSLVSLPEKQKQPDLIRFIKFLAGSNRCRTTWEWVEGHAVERKGQRHSSLPKRLNNQVDKLAKKSLIHAIASGHIIRGNFPFELVLFTLSSKKVCGSPQQALELDWGYQAAQALFSKKDIVHREDFHLVWWDGLGATMVLYPMMYHVWLTKHVSDFCGNNVQLYYWSKGTHSPKCKFCGIEDEHTTHICRCNNPGRDSIFCISVNEIHTWLVATLDKCPIASTVEAYLLARGQAMMESCIHGTNKDLVQVLRLTNHLGWDRFCEGRISTHWFVVVFPFLSIATCAYSILHGPQVHQYAA
jgi:hypothetical protein